VWSFSSYPERVAAVCDSGAEISYGALNGFAAIIREAVPARQLVFCLCSNTLGSLAGYTAFRGNRIVPLLLSSGLNQPLLEQLIQRYRPSYLWAPQDSQPGYSVRLRQFGYELLETKLAPPPLHDDLALLLTTSGSTGSPNLVRLSEDNLEANTASIVEYLGITGGERPITTLPMEYSYGLSIINSHLEVSATLLLTTNGLMQKEFWTFFKEQRATSFGGVPYTYEMLDRLRFSGMALPSLKTMTQAGGKLSADLQRKFAQIAQATGRRFFLMYGQTEATARISYLPPERLMEKSGSIGIAIPGGELSVAEADGELVYRGRNVALGYAATAGDLVKGSENGGVLATGDIGRRDADGYFYISGRKKRFIKVYGNRVNLDEAERLIQSAFPDLGVACAGSDDRMAIFLTGKDEAAEVKRFLAEKTGLNPAAFAVTLIPAIPRNDVGKTLYAQLEAVPCGR
jgi:long-chain acyl-CoA synthetase